MHLIDGKSLAARIRGEVKTDIEQIGLHPTLNILLVGEDPASHLYVSLKKKAGIEVGVNVEVFEFSTSVSDAELIALIKKWNQDPSVHAFLVQIPLPPPHDEDKMIAAIDPRKDVDGFHPKTTSIPPVHEGILQLINETPLRLNGAQATILANSNVFAAPLKRLLTTAGMSVRVMFPDALDRTALAESDVIVIAVGRINFLDASMTKSDAVIIDVGTNKGNDGTVRGDVNIETFQDQNVWITPVPGGVGPMTIAQLLKNVVRLARQK